VSTILVTGADLAPQALALLEGHKVFFTGPAPTEHDVIALCARHNPQALLLRHGRIGAVAMNAAPALKVISVHGSGTDAIDVAAARMLGIEVVAAAGVNAAAVAEQALALLLACAKSVVALDARMHAGHWDKATHKNIELGGRTVGVVGLGAIGLRFARMAHGVGMRVLGFDPFGKVLPHYIEHVPLETLWGASDAISLHCPLTDENRGLVDADTLSRCRHGLILVNTARGELVDEGALLAALRSGQVHSAGLDSFAIEPLADGHPFLSHPRLVLSPHIGGVTEEAYVQLGVAAARNALDVLMRGRSPT